MPSTTKDLIMNFAKDENGDMYLKSIGKEKENILYDVRAGMENLPEHVQNIIWGAKMEQYLKPAGTQLDNNKDGAKSPYDREIVQPDVLDQFAFKETKSKMNKKENYTLLDSVKTMEKHNELLMVRQAYREGRPSNYFIAKFHAANSDFKMQCEMWPNDYMFM